MSRHTEIARSSAIDTPETTAPPPRDRRNPRRSRRFPTAALILAVALALCFCGSPAQAKQPPQEQQPQPQQDDQQQMRGLDEQVQEIKSDVLDIAQELSRLEEKLLYPSGTQVAVFIELATGEQMRLDAVRLEIDGELVAHYIYSAKELEALRKGGVQRLYVGNVATGEHRLDVLVDAVLPNGEDFSHSQQFSFRKEVKPELVGLTVGGPASGASPITLTDW